MPSAFRRAPSVRIMRYGWVAVSVYEACVYWGCITIWSEGAATHDACEGLMKFVSVQFVEEQLCAGRF